LLLFFQKKKTFLSFLKKQKKVSLLF